MTSEQQKIVIQKAQERLKIDPFDAGHDLNHHIEVVVNCQFIIEEEGLKVDNEALFIAAWWHDYKRKDVSENDRILTEEMSKAGYDGAFISKVLAIKNSHSYGKEQSLLESQILFDADKLEYVSGDRIAQIRIAVEKGEMLDETEEKYKKYFKERIPFIPDQLHFLSSKQEFQRRKSLLAVLFKENQLWEELLPVMLL